MPAPSPFTRNPSHSNLPASRVTVKCTSCRAAVVLSNPGNALSDQAVECCELCPLLDCISENCTLPVSSDFRIVQSPLSGPFAKSAIVLTRTIVTTIKTAFCRFMRILLAPPALQHVCVFQFDQLVEIKIFKPMAARLLDELWGDSHHLRAHDFIGVQVRNPRRFQG